MTSPWCSVMNTTVQTWRIRQSSCWNCNGGRPVQKERVITTGQKMAEKTVDTKGSMAGNVEPNGSWSVPSSLHTASHTSAVQKATPLWHQKQTHASQSYSPPSSTTTVHHAPFSRVALEANYLVTLFPAIPPDIRGKLINTGKENLSELPSRSQGTLRTST